MSRMNHLLSAAWHGCLWLACSLWLATTQAADRDVEILVVTGAPGEAEYARRFEEQVNIWKQAAEKAGVEITCIGKDDHDAEALQAALARAAGRKTGQLWLVLIGHGSFDQREVKFNLRGPDVSPTQLAEWCRPIEREMIFIAGGSASAGFLQALASEKRVLISGTKRAEEIYYTRFGEFFAPAIAGDLTADLDADRQVSLLEAFRHASRQVTEFYEKEERIATEHALIEDNGDGVGTRAEAFIQPSKDLRDGSRAAQIALVLSEEERRLSEEQRRQRDALERELEVLKASRSSLKEEEYFEKVEVLLRQLSEVYAQEP